MAYYTRIQLSALQTRALTRLGNSVYYSANEVKVYINEAIRMYQLCTGFWKKHVSVQAVANRVYYPMPAGMLAIERVEWNGTPMRLKTRYELDCENPQWQADVTTSSSTRVKDWAPHGLSYFIVHPASYTAADLFTLDGIATAPVLSSGTDYLDLGDEDITTLLDYVEHIGLFKIGGAEFANSIKLLKQFIGRCAERNAKLKSTNFFKKWMGRDMGRIEKPRLVATDPAVGAR